MAKSACTQGAVRVIGFHVLPSSELHTSRSVGFSESRQPPSMKSLPLNAWQPALSRGSHGASAVSSFHDKLIAMN